MLFFIQRDGDQHKDNPEKECGQHHRYKEDTHEVHRIDQHICKDHCRDGSRCTQAMIRSVLFLFEVCWQYGDQQGRDVEDDKAERPHLFTQLCFTYTLYIRRKEIEREHVKDKMHVIGVQETVGKQPVPFTPSDRRRIKDHPLHHCVVSECENGDDGGKHNDGDGDHGDCCLSFNAKYFHNGAAMVACIICSLVSSALTSSKEKRCTVRSSDSSRA